MTIFLKVAISSLVTAPSIFDSLAAKAMTPVAKTCSDSSLYWYSLVLGFDYYHYTKSFWFHSWASVLPLHVSAKNEYSWEKQEASLLKLFD